MAEIDATFIAGLTVATLVTFTSAWFINGHLARNFEKRKKKYEIKLERYSVIVSCLGYWSWVWNFVGAQKRLQESTDKLLSKKDEPIEDKEIVRLKGEEWLAWSHLMMLKRQVGQDVAEDYAQRREETFFTYPSGNVLEPRLSNQETLEQILSRQIYLTNEQKICEEANLARLTRALADIQVLGSQHLASQINKLTASGELERAISDSKRMESLIDSVVNALAEDLEKTL